MIECVRIENMLIQLHFVTVNGETSQQIGDERNNHIGFEKQIKRTVLLEEKITIFSKHTISNNFFISLPSSHSHPKQ